MEIRSKIKIYVYGKELYRFINALHTERIHCTDQFCRNDIFCGTILRRDLPKVKTLTKQFKARLKYSEAESIAGIIRRYKLRAGFFTGMAVILISMFCFSGIVTVIDIQGNSIVSDQVILSALEELDVTCGSRIRDIDFELTENKLRLKVKDLSWVGMHRSGSRIVVKVTEVQPRPEIIPYHIPCNVVSSETAKIISTVVQDGLLVHSKGETVPKGTLLISGVTTDELGHTILHHAMGDIIGVYKRQISFSEPYSQTVYKLTGRKKAVSRLQLFGFDIPLFSGRNQFDDYEMQCYDHPLRLFGKQLPVSIIHRRYCERIPADAEFSAEELSQRLMQKVYLYEKNFLKDTEILERKTETQKTGEGMTVTVNYILQGNICESRELFIKGKK